MLSAGEDQPVGRAAVDRALRRSASTSAALIAAKLLSIEADGRQWTLSALGRVLDQSELQDNFFTTDSTVTAAVELESSELNLRQ